jgi:integrase
VDALLSRMQKAGAARNTMIRVRMVLDMGYKDAIGRKKVTWNPCAPVTVPADTKPAKPEAERSFTAEQARRLLDQAHADEDRLAVAWLLMIHRGLRPGEVTGLRWQDIDTDAGLLHVRQARLHDPDGTMRFGEPKTKDSARTLALSPVLVDALRLHRKRQKEDQLASPTWEDHELVVTTGRGTPVDRSALRRAFRRLTEAAGLGKDHHPHECRHTYATLARKAGVPEWQYASDMGHKPGSRVTGATYAHDQREVRGGEAGEAIAGALEEARA